MILGDLVGVIVVIIFTISTQPNTFLFLLSFQVYVISQDSLEKFGYNLRNSLPMNHDTNS